MSETAGHGLASVLFVCTLNSVRSPIAEGLARQILDRTVYIESAGLTRSERDGFTLAVLREIGIDLSPDAHRTLNDVGLEGFDVVVTLSSEANAVVSERLRSTAVTHLNWPVDDPTQAGGARDTRLAAYRAVRDQIRARIKAEVVPLQRRRTS